MTNQRILVGLLSLSAAGFGGIVLHESYTDRAIIPTVNDRPTVGFGSTFREDGSAVQMGDRISPPKAVARSIAHIAKDEAGLKSCIPPTTELSQKEYDILVDFAYQYGVSTTCKSSIVKQLIAGNYAASCEAYTLYKYSGGYDCSLPDNRTCPGVWTRNLKRRDDCLGAQ